MTVDEQYIPDPIELMQMREDYEASKVDADGTYPCVECGRRFPIEGMISLDTEGGGRVVCGLTGCKSEEIGDAVADKMMKRLFPTEELFQVPEEGSLYEHLEEDEPRFPRLNKFLDWLATGWEQGDRRGMW